MKISLKRTVSSSVVNSLSIDIGVSNRYIKESWVINRRAVLIVKHENFNGNTLANDIALVKLSVIIFYKKKLRNNFNSCFFQTPITLDNKYYIPACLPETISGLDFDSQEKTVWLTGWGSTYFQGPVTIDKMEVSMNVLTDTRCKQKYAQMLNPLAQICAGELGLNNGILE